MLNKTQLIFKQSKKGLSPFNVVDKAANHFEAKKIISRQMGDNKKTKLANFIVQTSFGKWYTIRSVEKILNNKSLKKN